MTITAAPSSFRRSMISPRFFLYSGIGTDCRALQDRQQNSALELRALQWGINGDERDQYGKAVPLKHFLSFP